MYNYEHIWTQSCTLKQNIFNEKFFSLRKYLFIWEGDFFVVKFIMKKKNWAHGISVFGLHKKAKNMWNPLN